VTMKDQFARFRGPYHAISSSIMRTSPESVMSRGANGTKSELPFAQEGFCEGSVAKENSHDNSKTAISRMLVHLAFLALLCTVSTLLASLNRMTSSKDPFASDCTSFISPQNGAFDRFSAANYASAQREKWLFGYSTRLAADEALSHLGEIQLVPNDGANGVQRGDLVLLCVHSIPETDNPTVKTNVDALTLVDGGSRAKFKNGQLLVGIMGARYAPDVAHGLEHASLDVPNGGKPLVLLSSAGTYGALNFLFQPRTNSHLDDSSALKTKLYVPVSLAPVGRLVRDDGRAYNIRDAYLRNEEWRKDGAVKSALGEDVNVKRSELQIGPEGRGAMEQSAIPIFVFTGVAMNSGKSLAMAHFIRGLNRTGLVVGAAKVTGTDYPKDGNYYSQGGATYVCTFADFGVSSTSNLPESELDRIVSSSIARLTHQGSQVIVLELADGIRAPDARYLLGPRSNVLRSRLTSILLAANNGLSGLAAVDEIFRIGLGDKLGGITGILTSSLLAATEFTDLEAEQRPNRKPTTLVSIQDAANECFCASFLKQWWQPQLESSGTAPPMQIFKDIDLACGLDKSRRVANE
jgi:hypothetical protein